MASRPSRSLCAPAIFAIAFLFVGSLLVSDVGCGRKENPPAAAEVEPQPTAMAVVEGRASLGKDANGEAEKTRVGNEGTPVDDSPQVEGAGKSLDGMKSKFKGKVPAPGHAAIGGFAGGFGGNQANVGQLFQGGGGVFGFGGGRNAGMFGNGAANKAFLFDPTTPPDGRNADMSGEQYERFEDNPFRFVRGEDALSTISTAVDTASYSNVRARINEGELPKKDAVRIADFVNYFPYDYPAPKNADPVAFKLELAPCPWQPTHHVLRVGLKAKVIDKDQMPARNLVFLIDTSGSMQADNRLPLVQESLKLLTEQLTGRDRVSIVTYAGTAGLLLPPTPGDQKERIVQEILALSAGGSTNGEGGSRRPTNRRRNPSSRTASTA
jgi:hypothetical protein